MSTTLTQADQNLNYINELYEKLRGTFPNAGTILDGGQLDSVLVNFSCDLSGDGRPWSLGMSFRSSYHNSPIAELKLTADKGSFRWCTSPMLHHIELLKGFFDQLFPQRPKPIAPIFEVEPRYDNPDLNSLVTAVHLFFKCYKFRLDSNSHLRDVKEFHRNVRVLPKSYTIKLTQIDNLRYQIGIFSGSVEVANLLVHQNLYNPLEVRVAIKACNDRATKFTWSNLIGIFGCMEISNGVKIDIRSARFGEIGYTTILTKKTPVTCNPVYLYNDLFVQGLLQSAQQ